MTSASDDGKGKNEAAKTRRRKRKAEESERIDEALDETFPASDPPACSEPAPKHKKTPDS